LLETTRGPLYDRSQNHSRISTGCDDKSGVDADGSRAGRHDGDHCLRVFVSCITGGDIRFADYAGHPILVVNTASLCGFTPQYAGLQQLWTELHDRGLMIIGVPSNDFGGQEPGGATEIAETAQHQYGVTFPIAAKAIVRGPNAHPFYKWAANARPKDVPRWNFHKYLVGHDGYLAEAFPESVEPLDTRVKTAIARALADS
jgi:glutathione peroxidase